MLSAIITVLFACASLLAIASIAHSLTEAHAAWARLMREGEVLRAALAFEESLVEMSLRAAALPASRRAIARVTVMPRPAVLLPLALPRPACVAA